MIFWFIFRYLAMTCANMQPFHCKIANAASDRCIGKFRLCQEWDTCIVTRQGEYQTPLQAR